MNIPKKKLTIAEEVTNTLKTSIYDDLTNLIHSQITSYGSHIQINQIQKVSDNTAEHLKDDFKDVFDRIASVSDKINSNEKTLLDCNTKIDEL